MKLRYIDERVNTNILEKKIYFEKVNDEMFNGYIGVTDIYKVDHIVKVPRDGREDDCILDAGYKRIRILPIDKNYAINSIFNEKSEFIEFYIDIIRCVKIEEKTNVPYMEDLYVDVVYTNKNEIIILDEDELDEALEDNEISKEEYDIVNKTKKELVEMLSDKTKAENLIKYCSNNLVRLLPKAK